jgi:hypothetical protein
MVGLTLDRMAAGAGWRKRLSCRPQTPKSQNPVDADSFPNHVSESGRLQVTRDPALQHRGEAVTYYGFYLFAIALVVMVGQLAFALYQVANLVLS